MDTHLHQEGRTVTALEGGDDVGKNNLSIALALYLAEQGYEVVYTNFPQYWFLGTAIRQMNKDTDAMEYLKGLDGPQEAKVRCGLYALDRALVLSVLEAELQYSRNPWVVSDRWADSNAVTLTYLLSVGRITLEEYEELIAWMEGLEVEIRDSFQTNSVLCLAGESFQLHQREALDSLEQPDVQRGIVGSYRRLGDRVKEVNTKENGVWRPTSRIIRDLVDLTGVSTVGNGVYGYVRTVGPEEFIRFYGVGHSIDLERKVEEWKSLMFANPLDPTRKVRLNELEPQIAQLLISDPRSLSLRNLRNRSTTTIAVKRILREYPECKDVLARAMGSDVLTFLERIEGL